MKEYLHYCESKSISVLLLLRGGEYELPILQGMLFDVGDYTFNDIISMLKVKNFIRLIDENTNAQITDTGRVYLLTEAQGIVYRGDGMLLGDHTTHEHTINVDPSIHWKHGEMKLSKLSVELFVANFLQYENALVFAFDAETRIKCDWKGNHTTLLYLLWLVLSKGAKSIPNFVRTVVYERFTIKGEQKTEDEIRASIGKVKPFLSKDITELNGGYLKIYSIYENSIL